MNDTHASKWKRRRLWLALALLVVLLAIVVMPPMVSISRYKTRITQLLSESLGRPVRLSSVELRLLPLPGFVLTDLTVEEDPAYGAEPVLRANTVTATIRLLSLWRGHVEIATISVDEASFNVVRTAEGRWNLDPLFRTAAAKTQTAGQGKLARPMPLPYIEATHARVNFKQGAEKLPFSLVDTELSFWQDRPGAWNVRLRGQPARTDVSLDLADTGVVRLEAKAQSAQVLRHMPIHLDVEWREAQLGQLTRLLIGSDPGWRGDLTGELHLDGTPESAQIKTRLRAAGVHRAEFAPAAAMDFDATCSLLFHSPQRAVENLACDSPFGDGRVRLAGDLPGSGGSPHLSVELERFPVAAGLDALRTVRSDFGAGLEVKGSVSGKINYAAVAAEAAEKLPARKERVGSRSAKGREAVQSPLTGSFTVDGFELSGEGLSKPIEAAKLVLVPATAAMAAAAGNQPSSALPVGLETKVGIGAGASAPLTVTARLVLSGYQITLRGLASLARARELARMAGVANVASLDELAGDAATLDLTADGPWWPASVLPESSAAAGAGLPAAVLLAKGAVAMPGDTLTGTVTLHNANWTASYLANHVEIAQATLHLEDQNLHWDPINFSYGPVKGTARLDVPARCAEGGNCTPTFQVQFDELDASAMQAAILGAREPGTMLSTLLARFHPASAPAWPVVDGSVHADSLVLGSITLNGVTAKLRIADGAAEISAIDADLLDGHFSGRGALRGAGPSQPKPAYTIEGHFEKLSPAAVGRVVGQTWTGRSLAGDAKVELSGFTEEELAASAKGTLKFDWEHGAVGMGDEAPPVAEAVPATLARFDKWTADAEIADGKVTLKNSQVLQGARKRPMEGALTLASPPRVTWAPAKETQAKR